MKPSRMAMMTKDDPALAAVRKVRSEISREFGNDPARLIAHYAELQAQFKGRLISGPKDYGECPETTLEIQREP